MPQRGDLQTPWRTGSAMPLLPSRASTKGAQAAARKYVVRPSSDCIPADFAKLE